MSDIKLTQDEHAQLLARAAEHLCTHDPIIDTLIQHYGPCTITPHTDYYRELVDSIISQQLSIKAAGTIWQRFLALFDGTFPMPEQVVAIPVDELRQAGLSGAKAGYIKDLATHILDGRLELNKISELDDALVINELTAVRGIGRWTAHMFLIFSLGRTDVLPADDLGIRNGIRKLYQFDHLPTVSEVETLAEKNNWHPFASIACWYIWRSLDNVPSQSTLAQS